MTSRDSTSSRLRARSSRAGSHGWVRVCEPMSRPSACASATCWAVASRWRSWIDSRVSQSKRSLPGRYSEQTNSVAGMSRLRSIGHAVSTTLA